MSSISVIVPVYKAEKYLERCVLSILNQSYADFELILVDDGSPDKSGEMCDAFAKKDKRITVIHKENEGPANARNKGIDHALNNSDSQWIMFVDSDDWIHHDFIKIMYESAFKFGVDISCCCIKNVDTDISDKDENFDSIKCTPEEFSSKYDGNIWSLCGRLYKKELWINNRITENQFNGEDADTIYKILFTQKYIAYVGSGLYYYFNNCESITHSEWSPKMLYNLAALENQIVYLKANGFELTYKKSVISFLWNMANHIVNSHKSPEYKNYYYDLSRRFEDSMKKFNSVIGDKAYTIRMQSIDYEIFDRDQKKKLIKYTLKYKGIKGLIKLLRSRK